MVAELTNYHASIVPLAVNITGAVPSKIFDLLQIVVEILFCAGGECSKIVIDHKIGFTSNPSDYAALEANIRKISSLPLDGYKQLKCNCYEAARSYFSYEQQTKKYVDFLMQLTDTSQIN